MTQETSTRFRRASNLTIIAFALGLLPVAQGYFSPAEDALAPNAVIDSRLAPRNEVLVRSSLSKDDIKSTLTAALANLLVPLELTTVDRSKLVTARTAEIEADDIIDVKLESPSVLIDGRTNSDFRVRLNWPLEGIIDPFTFLQQCLNGLTCQVPRDDPDRLVEPNWYQFHFESEPGVVNRCANYVPRDELSEALRLIKANTASVTKAPAVTVGVADSGGAVHDDLSNLVVSAKDADVSGHGTHLAGIVGADRDGEGIVGVAPEVELIAARFLDANGRGTAGDAIDALRSVVDRSDIVLLAWGTTRKTEDICGMIEAHPEVLFVAAAGNLAQNLTQHKIYPASCQLLYPNLISVMATDLKGKRAVFSNYGADIAAPGDDPGQGICSTVLGDQYGRSSGTSVAAAYVAGAAALVKQKNYDWSGAQIREALIKSEAPPKCDKCAGMLDVAAAVQR
jgi:subtilisin family serine protease